jgi:hypothetical protein
MDDYRLRIGVGPFLYLAIFRYSRLWQLGILWIDFPGMPSANAKDELE